jgi:hypothetical protein
MKPAYDINTGETETARHFRSGQFQKIFLNVEVPGMRTHAYLLSLTAQTWETNDY